MYSVELHHVAGNQTVESGDSGVLLLTGFRAERLD